MIPILEPNQLIITKSIDPIALRVNDIIVFEYLDKLLVKRLIGLQNQHITIEDDKIYCNEDLVYSYPRAKTQYYEWQIPKDNFGVIGDNPNNSLDSRKIGFIHKNQIRYKAIARIWPPKRL